MKSKRASRAERSTAPRRTARPAGRSGGAVPGGRKPRSQSTAVVQQAERHKRVRRDHSDEIKEDYVELIAQLIREHGEARTVDLAARLGVSHVTVTKTIARLQRDGLVHSEPYRSIFLTTQGSDLAQRSSTRHTLVVAFLRKLGVNDADAETDAEGIEHHLSAATLAAMMNFVDR